MLKYFISSICLLCCLLAQAQTSQKNTKVLKEIKRDSVGEFYNPKTYGLRIGADLIKPILSYTNDKFKGGAILADYRINTRLFAAGEIGYMQKTIEEDSYNHEAKGSYIKLGINYNLYTNWLDMDNETFLGFRYGNSFFTDQLNSYTIAQNGEYFSPKTVNNNTTYKGLNAHWIELVAGIKVEVFKNLFLGIMVSVNKMISINNPTNYKVFYSPGFGKISENGGGASISYIISYRIPFYKK